MRQRPVHNRSSTEYVQRAEAKSHEYIYAGDLKSEFDALYAEGEHRRMMSVSAHDRIEGRASRTKTQEEFNSYAQSHPGVVFMRKKDEIANFALSSRQTIREAI